MDVLLDTSILIAAERESSIVIPGEEVALPAVAVMEYWKGVQRADSETRRRARISFFEDAFGDLPVVPFDASTAKTAARVWADLEEAGNLIPAFDLLIAATAIEHDLSLATADVRDFARVSGLRLIDVDS